MNSKKILYLTTDLLFLNTVKAGGSAVQESHLSILMKLGYQIKVVLINCEKFSNSAPKLLKDTQTFSYNGVDFSVDEVQLYRTDNSELSFLERISKMIFNPTDYYYNFVNKVNQSFLDAYFNKIEFSFIWAQWFYAGLLAASHKEKQKVFYVHHDWQYKLVDFKKEKGLKTKILKFSKKRIEEKLTRDVTAVVCVSSTDADYLNAKRINSLYLTTTYDKTNIELLKPKEKPSLVHLGSLNATANRVGLKNFILNSWEDVKKEIPGICLEIVGELSVEDQELTALLQNDKNIILHKFVENLNTVLRPLDIHIIPWDKNTGTRTRLALTLQYKQCLVARKEGVANAKEIVQNVNALLSDSWPSYTKDIVNLYNNRTLRDTIAANSFKTYTENFTHESQLKNVASFIKENR